MNKKGFTLVEILAVIVILGLIMVIVATKGFGAFNSTKNEIAKLNNKAIEEGLELLKVDIENCNDELDSDIYNGMFKFDNCHEMITNIGGKEITLKTLIENGYIEGAGVEEINNKEYQTYSTVVRVDENDKVSFDEFKPTELIAYMQKDILMGNVAKEKIVKIEFVNYVDNNASKWDITTVGENEKVYAWLEEVGTDTYNLFVGSKGKIYAPVDSSFMFSEFINVKNIYFSNFNTNNVTNMRAMFHRCDALVELDLSIFNTSKVENMSWMFRKCSGLTKIDLSSFDTNNVTDMSVMFEEASLLEELDLSTFKSNDSTNVSNMFNGTNNLKRVYFKEGMANKLENALPSSVEKIYK